MQMAQTQRAISIGVSRDSVRNQLEKILASRTFAAAAQLSRFLSFVVERALQDSAATLTEQQIGREVFGKPESFDPRVDPIVRVQASRVRAKLRTYYASAGTEDVLVIELPPRCYSPVISRVPAGSASSPSRMGPHSVSRSIAVSPFASFGKWSESFNRGFTEELVHALNELTGLQVLAWHAGVPSHPKASGVREVARQFSVYAILEGGSRRSQNTVRVSVRLIKVENGSVLWSHMYRDSIKDVVGLQEHIAGEVARAISIRKDLSLASGLPSFGQSVPA